EVLPDAPRCDGMPLGLQRADALLGEEAERPLRAAVMLVVALGVALQAQPSDARGGYRVFRHATGRHADLNDPGAPVHDLTSMSIHHHPFFPDVETSGLWSRARFHGLGAVLGALR